MWCKKIYRNRTYGSREISATLLRRHFAFFRCFIKASSMTFSFNCLKYSWYNVHYLILSLSIFLSVLKKMSFSVHFLCFDDTKSTVRIQCVPFFSKYIAPHERKCHSTEDNSAKQQNSTEHVFLCGKMAFPINNQIVNFTTWRTPMG